MGISKGLSFVCLIAMFITLLFIKVANADSSHFGIHAVGHAIDPFCPGGYSDRGDHCQNIGHISAKDDVNDDDDFVDHPFQFVGDKVPMHLSMSESTEAAEKQAEILDSDNVSPESIARKVIVLGH